MDAAQPIVGEHPHPRIPQEGDDMAMTLGIGLVFVAVGLLFLGKAVADSRTRRRAQRSWPAVDGVVLAEDTDSLGSGTVALIGFTTVEGQPVRATVDSTVRTGFFRDGRTVRVHYDPEDPTRIVTHLHTGDSSALATATLGVVILALGVGALLVSL